MPLDQPGRLRLGNLMYLFQCSRQTIYAYIEQKKIPKPDGKDGRPYWLTSSIRPYFVEKDATRNGTGGKK